ncbi:hypothetical protein L208DRAFT_1281992, partial [Tricholoma matsutake]
LKGPQYATIDMPPNNALFDTLDPCTVAAKSPLLQCRLQFNTEAKAAQEIHNHINLPAELLGLFRPPVLPGPLLDTHASTPMLLPPTFKPGQKMTIEDLCTQFSLSTKILD